MDTIQIELGAKQMIDHIGIGASDFEATGTNDRGKRRWQRPKDCYLPLSSRTEFKRSELSTTMEDDKAIAAPANIGDNRIPATG